MGEGNILCHHAAGERGERMKLSLLIVDDDEVMRNTLSDVLKKKG